MFSANLELVISENRLRLMDPKSGHQVERTATPPFSTGDLVIGYRDIVRAMLRDMIDANPGHSRWALWPRIHARFSDHLPHEQEVADLKTLLKDLGFQKIEVDREAANS